jgi:hypothetical protein
MVTVGGWAVYDIFKKKVFYANGYGRPREVLCSKK